MAEKEYIEKNHLINTIINSTALYNATVLYLIKREPAVDVQELRHGNWIKNNEHISFDNGKVAEWTNFYCSECDAPNTFPTKYCPECGAKMKMNTTLITED